MRDARIAEMYPFERAVFIFCSARRRILVPCSSTGLARSAKTATGTTALWPAAERTGRSPMCGATRRPTLTAATSRTCRGVNAAGLDHRSAPRQVATPPASNSGGTSISSLSFGRRTLLGYDSDLAAQDARRHRSPGRARGAEGSRRGISGSDYDRMRGCAGRGRGGRRGVGGWPLLANGHGESRTGVARFHPASPHSRRARPLGRRATAGCP